MATPAYSLPEIQERVEEIRGIFAAGPHAALAQAWYWTAENQARIREADHLITPELRAEVLAEAAGDYAALAQDPVALAASQAEDALWESTVGNSLDAD